MDPGPQGPGSAFLAFEGHLDIARFVRFARYRRVAQRHAFGQPPLFDADGLDP